MKKYSDTPTWKGAQCKSRSDIHPAKEKWKRKKNNDAERPWIGPRLLGVGVRELKHGFEPTVAIFSNFRGFLMTFKEFLIE